MRNTLTIAEKELRAYLGSPMAYISGFVFLLVMGFGFVLFLKNAAVDEVLYSTTMIMVWVLLFVAPALTMHLYAEERRSGTIELLMTYPLQDWEVVLGKFLAAFTLFLGMVAITAVVYPTFLVLYGSPDMGIILSSYLGIILIGASYVALGVLASALTKNQTVSAIIGIGALFALMLCYYAGGLDLFGLGKVLAYLSPVEHFINSFGQGAINTRDLVYYLTFIFFLLFLSVRVVEIKRWQ
ncbi:MAG TPA: ABC transporter permease [bacterium]|nr:ABC transporter permease [bacterium]